MLLELFLKKAEWGAQFSRYKFLLNMLSLAVTEESKNAPASEE